MTNGSKAGILQVQNRYCLEYFTTVLQYLSYHILTIAGKKRFNGLLNPSLKKIVLSVGMLIHLLTLHKI